MAVSMVLFEHASGYALFRVQEFEETSALEAEVEASIMDVSAFNSVVNLVAFSPFGSALVALTNINSVSEGAVTDGKRTKPFQGFFLCTWLGNHATTMSQDVTNIREERADFASGNRGGVTFHGFVFDRKGPF